MSLLNQKLKIVLTVHLIINYQINDQLIIKYNNRFLESNQRLTASKIKVLISLRKMMILKLRSLIKIEIIEL